MIRKIIHTNQESVVMLELPENLQGRRIEIIAFEIEEDMQTTVVNNDDGLEEDVKNWHTVNESEAIVLEAVKQHYASRHNAAVTEKLKQLVIILVDENYFATEEGAEKYVQDIYKFMRTVPNLTHRKTKETSQNKFYVSYKANRRTTWYYVLFTIKKERYFIHNVFNNHSPDYPVFINSLK